MFDDLEIFKDLKTQEVIDELFKKKKPQSPSIFNALVDELKVRFKS